MVDLQEPSMYQLVLYIQTKNNAYRGSGMLRTSIQIYELAAYFQTPDKRKLTLVFG